MSPSEKVVKTDTAGAALLQIVIKRTGASESPSLKLNIGRDATVIELKTLIERELLHTKNEDMPPTRQRLIYSGRILSKDQDQLLLDLKLKIDGVNYIHLAPLPKGATPTFRKQTELLSPGTSGLTRMAPSRRERSTTSRAYHPYRRRGLDPLTMQEESADRTTLASELLMDSHSVLHAYQQPHLSPPPPLAVPSLDASAATAAASSGVSSINMSDLEHDILHDVAALLPLSRVLPGRLYQVVGDQHALLSQDSEDMILLLEQVAHRSMILSLSLRSMDQARHVLLQQQLAAATVDGTPPTVAGSSSSLQDLMIASAAHHDGSLLGPYGYF